MIFKSLVVITLCSLLAINISADDISDDLSGFVDEDISVESDNDLAGFSDDDDLTGFSEEKISSEPLHVEKESMFILRYKSSSSFILFTIRCKTIR